MPEQEERAYRLFTFDETLGLADLNPEVEISPANVGRRITVPISRKQQLPNHNWRKDRERHDETCHLYQGRLGSILVSVPTNLTVKEVRPDMSYFGDQTIFSPCPYYYEDGSIVPATNATIQDGRLEKVEEIALQDQAILDTRSTIMDAIEKGDKTAHFSIDHPYRTHHTRNGNLLAFRDKVEEDRMIAVVVSDVRLYKTIAKTIAENDETVTVAISNVRLAKAIDEILSQHDPREFGSATEKAIRQEWSERMRAERQAFDLYGLKSFKFRKFPKGIPVTVLNKNGKIV